MTLDRHLWFLKLVSPSFAVFGCDNKTLDFADEKICGAGPQEMDICSSRHYSTPLALTRRYWVSLREHFGS